MKKMLLAMRVVYEGEEIAYDMSVGDGKMTIKWLGELSFPFASLLYSTDCASSCYVPS